jgi:hypothetical protein
LQTAICPAALPETSGPHEVAIDAVRLSAKEPVEHAPSVIAEPPVAVAAYAFGIICCIAGATVAAATTNAATMVPVNIIFVLIVSVFFIAVVQQKLQKMGYDYNLYMNIGVICYDLKYT